MVGNFLTTVWSRRETSLPEEGPECGSARDPYQVLLQLWQRFRENQLVMGLETLQLGKPWDEKPWKVGPITP